MVRYVVALIIFRLLSNISARERLCERDNTLNDITFDDGYFLFEASNILSKLRCVNLCQDNHACVSFGYNRVTLNCRFYSTGFRSAPDGIVESGWTNYKCRHKDCNEKDGFVYNYQFNICIYLSIELTTYEKAREHCGNKSSQIISLDTNAKIDMLDVLLSGELSALVTDHVFIGLTKVALPWIWENGNILGLSGNWYMFQPYCPLYLICNCVVAKQIRDWQWENVECDDSAQFVCEKDIS
ncbi:Collectin-12 [Mactra antiquata]